jgi:6-pyruvoyltetrahydropterin/6-carboxytetrahydropterin synthase
MFEISIKSQFCGAHSLPGYKGPCANQHGHNWEVEIFLGGARTNRLGMLVDFKDVKEILRDVLVKIDHRNLNQLPFFKKTNPTAENIAKFIFDELVPKLNSSNYRLRRVRVSETAGTAAYYSRR